ncbi:MAG: hypothetical protein QM399_01355 [Bacillota bacterium]|nr:hypothetical protein [Bacillota bacterium]
MINRVRLFCFLVIALLVTGCIYGGAIRYRISGVVVDEYGNPIEGVILTISGDFSGTASTDAEGMWEAVVRKTVTIVPSKEGYTFGPAS